MEAKQISLRDFSLSYNSLYKENSVLRDSLIDDIVDLLNKDNKLLIIEGIEGIEGIGKTNTLLQFAHRFNVNSFTYFINSSSSITSKQDYLMEDMGKQFYFFLNQEIPSRDLLVDEILFKELLFKIIKLRKNKPIYFIIDGLDQVSKSEVELIKPILSNLPWNTNNFYFILTGDLDNLRQILDNNILKNYKHLRVPRLTLEETYSLFGVKDAISKEYVKELHATWKGKPEDLNQVKSIIDSGTDLRNFVENDEIIGKQDLLEKIWQSSNLENKNFNDPIIQLVSIITFNDNIQSFHKICSIIGVDFSDIEGEVKQINFIDITDGHLYFITKSFRNFLAKKLKNYESKVSAILINYYTSLNDFESIVNLPTLYERNKGWADIVSLLSVDNIGMVIANSRSFSEIKKQINHGYRASENLSQSYANVLNFALYRSTLNGIQQSDNRESQIIACVALGEDDLAFSIMSNAILKEDRLKMLIVYVKECKIKKIDFDEVLIEEIKDTIKSIDRDFLVENIIDIASGIAYFLPELAIQIVEDVSGLKSQDNSLEWLMGYIGTIVNANRDSSDDIITVDTQEKGNKNNRLLERFSKSLGLGISGINESEIVNYLSDIESSTDKLYVIRKWIKKNKRSTNIISVIEFAFSLLLQSSSSIKPTTTILLDIVSPLPYISDYEVVKALIKRIDEIVIVVNTPTNDKIKIDRLIIQSLIKFDQAEANDRFFTLDSFVNSLADYSVKLEAQADCWALIKYIEKKNFVDEFISSEKFARENIINTLKDLLLATSEHFIEVESTISIISKIDLSFCLEIINLFNISDRRNDGVLKAIEIYTNQKVDKWDEKLIKKSIEKINDINLYTKAILRVISSASSQRKYTKNNKNKIIDILPLFNRVEDQIIKCYLITKSVIILNLEPNKYVSLKPTYSKLISKLEGFLIDFWTKIDIPYRKIEVGYKIVAELATYNKDLAKNYFFKTEQLSQSYLINNDSHSFCYNESIRLMIRVYCGMLESDKSFRYDKITNLISKVPSDIEKLQLWSELAVRSKLVDVNTITNEIVSRRIIPVLEDYKIKKDQHNYFLLLSVCASAIHFSQPDLLKLYLDKLPNHKREIIVEIVCYVLVTQYHESDPYYDKNGSKKVKFQDATEYISLLNYIEKDSRLFVNIKRLCYIPKSYPNIFSREQKIELKNQLLDLVRRKLPNTDTGVKHFGYSIVAEACIQWFNIAPDQQIGFYNGITMKVEQIDNLADKSLVYSVLAEECDNRKKKQEFISTAFDVADKITSVREKIEHYKIALETAQTISREIFNEKIRHIYNDIHKLDDSEMLPTSRTLIDLAYRVDKSIAQKLISSLDNDPARKRFVTPVNDHYEYLELEKEVLNDYSQFGRIRSRRRMSSLAIRMLGQLNADKRNSRELNQTLAIVRSASKLPFSYASPLFEFFIQNAIKQGSSLKALLPAFYDSTYHNSKLCFDLICSISNKKSNISIYNNTDSKDTFLALPGLRDEAFNFIGSIMKESGAKEIYIIDPYFTNKDLFFIKYISEWNFGASIVVLTSPEEKSDFSRFAYTNSWNQLSSEQPPHMSFISVVSRYDKSPIHDRWVLMYDKLEGIKIGSSIHSIGSNKVTEISSIGSQNVKELYESLIVPFVKHRVNEFEGVLMKYESFDL